MDFEFNDEQEQLRTSVRGFLASSGGTEWNGLVDLGVLDPELTMTDVGVVLEEMGRALYAGPYLSTRAARWAGFDDDRVATLALDRSRVPHAVDAEVVLVIEDGVLYECECTVDAIESIDPSSSFGAITVRTLGRRIGPVDEQSAVDRWNIGYVVDGVGAASVALEMAVAYSHERVQFDRPIGSFQAVQHLCADMLTSIELARAAAYYGLWAADSADAAELHRAATMAKAYASDALFKVGADAIQVFGGIGYTWEHEIHRFYKRLLTLQVVHGTASKHLDELAHLVI